MNKSAARYTDYDIGLGKKKTRSAMKEESKPNSKFYLINPQIYPFDTWEQVLMVSKGAVEHLTILSRDSYTPDSSGLGM